LPSMEAVHLNNRARRVVGDDSMAFQRFSYIDWGNPTEADLWLAADAGISSSSSSFPSEQAEGRKFSAFKSRCVIITSAPACVFADPQPSD
jgi:hypothetical protein